MSRSGSSAGSARPGLGVPSRDRDEQAHAAMRSTTTGPRRDGFLSPADRRGAASRPHVRVALQARMDDGERPLAVDALADRRQLGQADGMVDRVLRPGAAAAQATTARPSSRVAIACTTPARSAWIGGDDRRRLEVALRLVEEVARPAERRDHASEALGGAAGATALPRSGRAPSSIVAARRPSSSISARERHRHLVEARLAPAPGEIVDRVGDLDARCRRRVASGSFMSVRSAVGRQAGAVGDVDDALGELARVRRASP